MSGRRVMAIMRKELRDYRRSRQTVLTMSIVPLVFLVQPLVFILAEPSAAATSLRHTHELLYMLGIPVLAPAAVAAVSLVTERHLGTLEPLLTTPLRREELVLGKALAPLLPAVLVSYFVYLVFIAVIEIFAHPGVAGALLQGPVVIAQIVFTPLLACWSIWVGLAISTRSQDVRAAQQLSVLGNLPLVAITTLIALGTIKATLPLAIGLGIALLALDRLGWRVVSAMFDRERLVTG